MARENLPDERNNLPSGRENPPGRWINDPGGLGYNKGIVLIWPKPMVFLTWLVKEKIPFYIKLTEFKRIQQGIRYIRDVSIYKMNE